MSADVRFVVLGAPEALTESELSRRSFCLHACQVVSVAALAPLVQACGGSSPTSPSNAPALTVVNGTVAGSVLTYAIDGASPLNTVGGAALIRSSAGDFLAARTAATTVAVFTATCTHEQTTIDRFQAPNFVCPRHGSQFSQSGAAQNGPATQSLRQFASQLNGTTLTVTL